MVVLRAVASEIVAAVSHLARYPTAIGRRWAIQADQGAAVPQRPLVVLPGLADNTSIFTDLKRALEQCGAGPIVSFGYSPLIGDVRTAAGRLAEQVEQLCAVTGAATVDLVGHSLGGLIARYYVQRLGGHARVAIAVTIATPHAGTLAAWLLSPLPLVRQLRPGSELLAELEEPAPGCTTRFITYSSDTDQLILPARNGRLEHPGLRVRNIVVPDAGHLTLAVHPRVLTEICALFQPEISPPETGNPVARSA